MKNQTRWLTPTCLAGAICTFWVSSAAADCVPQGGPGADTIVCSGSDASGVAAGSGNDSVAVLPGASVTFAIGTPTATVRAIDGGPGNDSVDNAGTVSVTIAAGVVAAPAALDCRDSGDDSGNDPGNDRGGAVVGIAGGTGNDVLTNRGGVAVQTTRAEAAAPAAAASRCASQAAGKNPPPAEPAPVGSVGIEGGSGHDRIDNSGTLTVGETSAAIAQPVAAIGIAGGSGDDTIANGGSLTVTASALEDNTDFLDPLVTASRTAGSGAVVPSVPPAVPAATAIGIAGGDGKDTIANAGTLTVGATATLDGVTPSITLAGGDRVDASTAVDAQATGIAAGAGMDRIDNRGAISAAATAGVDNVAVEVNLIDLSYANTSTTVSSAATGIDGGSGSDKLGIGNAGTVTATATSRSANVAVEVNLIDAALSDSTLDVVSSATGIAVGSGHDRVDNAGTVSATANSTVSDVGVNVSFVDATAVRGRGGNVATTLESTAIGIDSGKGKDDIAVGSSGSVAARATSDVFSVGVSLASEGVPGATITLFRDFGLASIGIAANSMATGIATGGARDRLTVVGDIDAQATSTARQASINVGVAVFDYHIPTPGIVLGSAGTGADAVATGVATGSGDDTLDNAAQVDVDATATAAATTVSVNIAELGFDPFPEGTPSGPPVGASLVVADTATEAVATATGLAAGSGNDRVASSGTVEANATADSGSISVAATIDVKYKENTNFFALDAVGARATTDAEATAVGIDAGSGRNEIDNSGRTAATAIADGNTVGVSVVVSGTLQGAGGAINVAASDSSTNGDASARAIQGGDDRDAIGNRGSVEAVGRAEVDGVNVGVSAAIAEKGLVVGAALSRSVSAANATAVGIDGGGGRDAIDNAAGGSVSAEASADAGAVAVSVNIDGTTRGVAGGAALTDARTMANAVAVGIGTTAIAAAGSADAEEASAKAGRDDDAASRGSDYRDDQGRDDENRGRVYNAGSVTVDAQAHTHSIGVSAEVAVAEKGVALGAALANTNVAAAAQAVAVAGGSDDERFANAGSLSVGAGAGSTAVSVAVTITGTASGLAAGAALTDSSVTVDARAIGIDAGGGRDEVTNAGSIVFTPTEADATAVSVSVAGFFAQKGVTVGAALGRTQANASVAATAIDGGSGGDRLGSSGTITMNGVDAHADAVGVSLAVAVGQSGVGVSAALVDADATATASVTAIDGGSGGDRLENSGSIAIGEGVADADAVSVAVNVTGVQTGAAIGGALLDADATASLTASGLGGGSGDDAIYNIGTIGITGMKATSDAVGVGASLTVAGSTGVAAGGAFALTGSTASIGARALDGGSGDDAIHSGGLGLTLRGIRAEADAVSVSVGLSGGQSGLFIGAGLADATGKASADAAGIDGGADDDRIFGSAPIAVEDVKADAFAAGISVGAAGGNAGVAAGVSIANTSGIAGARARGIDGGSGDDLIASDGVVGLRRITADADALSVGVSLGVTLSGGVAGGVSLADASANATVDAVGVDAGSGDDKLINSAAVTLDTVNADAGATGVSVQLGVSNAGVAIGAALADSRVDARVAASGLGGGSGDDLLVNSGSVLLRSVGSRAGATSVGVTLNAAIQGGVAAGVSLTDASSHATTTVAGIAGGEGDDALYNHGSVRAEGIEANARATGVSVSVQASLGGVAAGAAIADTSGSATAVVKGLDGGAGDDTLTNDGVVDVAGKAKADALSIGISVSGSVGLAGGLQMTSADMRAESTAAGLDGGLGRDRIVSSGGVTATSTAETDAKAISVGVTIGIGGDASLADATTHANASAIGIDGGESAALPPRDDYGWPRKDDGCAGGDDWRRDRGCDGGDGDDDEPGGDTIVSSGAVLANATTIGRGTSAGGNLFGFALGELTNESIAGATGIRSGAGGDEVGNGGSIAANAKVTASGLSVAVTLGGKAMGDTSTTARAASAGIATGAGRDTIHNDGTITLDARADASARGVSVGLLGVAESDASVTASAAAIGIDAGGDDDTVVNRGSITAGSGTPTDNGGAASCPGVDDAAGSGSCARVGGVSVNLAGAGFLDATTESRSTAVGIDGGGGDDALGSDAAITARARAKTVAGGTNVNIFGAALSDAQTIAAADASGIRGGDGDDAIAVLGSVDAQSSAHIVVSNYGFSLAGTADFDATLDASALATAIDGGGGRDRIDNAASLVAGSTATVSSGGASTVVFGASASGARSGALADAAAMRGGADGDRIGNRGALSATAASTLSLGNSTFSFGGTAGADGELTATTRSSGIGGDGGDDHVVNAGAITAGATATLTAGSGSTVIFGTGSAGAATGALTDARGIAGGDGNDTLRNSAPVSADSTATLTLSGGSFTFGGTGAAGGSLSATTRSTAIDGGSGKDIIRNEGELQVDNTSTMSASSDSDVAFGSSGAQSTAGSVAAASGIDGGEDDDAIWSGGRIFVDTTADLSLSGSSYTFGGTGDVGGRLNSTTAAFGIQGGGGKDAIASEADISVTAGSTLASGGSINTTFGTSASGAVVTTDIGVAGIDGGSGDDAIDNFAGVDVAANATATTGSTSYVFGGSTAGDDVANAASNATGLRGGLGRDAIYNAGSVRAAAGATISSTGSAYAEFGGSRSSGTIVSGLTTRGIDGGADDDRVFNAGTVTAVGTGSAAMSHSTETGFLFGGGDSRASVRTTLAAFGIDLGQGANTLANDGAVSVDLLGTTSANTSSDGADIFDGDAFSRSDSVVTATAVGVGAGSGDDGIDNAGSIAVTTWRGTQRTGASADAYADGDGIDGDGTIVSYATTTLLAAGIDAGDGANAIRNSGTIDIDARVAASATGSVDSDAGGSSSADRRAIVDAAVFGIRSGTGDDTVFNSGSITVRVDANNNTGAGHVGAGATSIAGGAGNDTIVNAGTIRATRIVNGATTRGTAIDAGAGDDHVRLLDGSVTDGDIDLGTGVDLLSLEGTPVVTGGFLAGASSLSLEFASAGSFAGELPGVRAVKNGPGTFSLAMLNRLEYIEVNQGTLALEGGYDFLPDGVFQARVYGDGSHGRFEVKGEAGLAGHLKVVRGGGAYRDGARFAVFGSGTAIRDGSAFAAIELPAAMPLLAFGAQQTSDGVQVNAAVASFTRVAGGGNAMIVASHLDRILPTVSGDLSQVMGEIQALPGSGYAQAFAGLSPESLVPHSRAALAGTRQLGGVLQDRLAELRAGRLAPRAGKREPILLAYGGDSLAGLFARAEEQAAQRLGMWLRAFGQRGDRDPAAAASGFEYELAGVGIGIDRRLGERFTGGVAFATSRSKVRVDADLSSGDVDGSFLSAYGSYADGDLYVDGALTLGRNHYDARRNLVVGPTTTVLGSNHRGDVASASIGAGYFVRLGSWLVDPFAYLQFTRVDEDGFAESGSGAGLIVAPRSTDALVSTLGVRVSHPVAGRAGGTWIPEASLAWVRDLDGGDTVINAAYLDAPEASLSITDRAVGRNAAEIGLGLAYRASDGYSSRLRYTGDFRSGFAAHGIVGEVRWEF